MQVVDHGGFAAAARAVGQPKSKLSRRASGLEERLQVRLLQRSTRRVSVTELGQVYYTHCKAMLVQVEAAQEAINRSRPEPCGTVRMTCPVALLGARVSHMLAEFMIANPRVELHLEATNRRVDVIGEGIDIALRVRPPPLEDSDLVLRVLTERNQSLVASPRLAEELGKPGATEDLSRYPSLELGGPQQQHIWRLTGRDGVKAQIEHRPRYVTRDMTALRAAETAGVGVVQLPVMMFKDDLERGELIHLLPGWAPKPEIIHAVFPSRRGLLPAVRLLVDFLATRFSELNEY